MAKNFRRMFAMVMVLCMILSALPMQALAEETTHDGLTITITPSEGSGSSGGESGGSGSSGSDDSSGSGSSGSDESSGSGSGESSSSSAPTSKVEVSGTSTSTGATVNMNGTQTETSSSTNSTSTDNSTTTTTTSESNIVLSGTATESDGTQKQISYEGTNTETETEEVTKDEATGNTTTNTTTDVTWKGTEQDGDITKAVSGKETTEESSTTNADGEKIASSFEVNGSEKKEWTEDIEVGQEVPSVKVDVVPGNAEENGTNTGKATDTIQDIIDNLEGGSNDKHSDKTTITTVIDREVTVEAGEITTESSSGDVTFKPVAPELWNKEDGVFVNGCYEDGTEKTDIYYAENDIVGMGTMTWNDETQKWETIRWSDDGEYRLGGWGEQTKVKVDYYSGDTVHSDASPQFALHDKNGNIVYAYCVDLDTGTTWGSYYDVSNLEDSDYYASEDAEAHIRAIVKNGYWGSSNELDKESGTYQTGSLAKIKESLQKAFESGDLTDEDITIKGEDGEDTTIKLSELMQGLTEGEALAVTQAAIWTFANGSYANPDATTGDVVVGATGFSGGNSTRTKTLYNYLISLTEEMQSESIVIDETSFLEEGSMSLVVGEKVGEVESETSGGETQVNDVYNVGVNFKLAFIPDPKNDDLLVCLTDENGNTLKDKDGAPIIRRLAGKNSDAQDYETILPAEDGSYTLTGLQLAENTDFTFDLKLEGTQHLEQGVYVYSPVGGRKSSQTMVGMAEGTREVSVSTSLTVSFSVDESSHVVAERVWHHENDPVVKPTDGGKDPTPTVSRRDGGEPAPRPQVFRLNNQNEELVEIPEEPVPLATPAITGDNSGLWVAVILIALCGIVAVNVFDKKRQHESF